jgi:quercetin dioxygenase-like cupin family protein
MLKRLTLGAVFAVAAVSLAVAADAPQVVRKVLNQQDTANNQTMAEIDVTIPVGGREGRHTHPGPLMAYVLSGVISLDYEGKPQTDYKAGDAFFVESGKIHEGINKGNVAAHAIATFAGPKGRRSRRRCNRTHCHGPVGRGDSGGEGRASI